MFSGCQSNKPNSVEFVKKALLVLILQFKMSREKIPLENILLAHFVHKLRNFTALHTAY